MSSNNFNEETLNPAIIELVELGNDYNKVFPNSNTIISSTDEKTTREQIRERLRKTIELAKLLSDN